MHWQKLLRHAIFTGNTTARPCHTSFWSFSTGFLSHFKLIASNLANVASAMRRMRNIYARVSRCLLFALSPSLSPYLSLCRTLAGSGVCAQCAHLPHNCQVMIFYTPKNKEQKAAAARRLSHTQRGTHIHKRTLAHILACADIRTGHNFHVA